MRRRRLCVLLTLCMICTLLPAQLTLAAEDTWNGDWFYESETNIIGFNYGDKGHLLVTMPTELDHCIYGTATTDAVLQVIETEIPKNELPESGWNWALQTNENKDSYTLILNNATIKSNCGDALMIGKWGEGTTLDKMNITIEVRGENLIESNIYGIATANTKSLTIGGSGTLTLKGGSCGLSHDLYHPDVPGTLDITDTVTITASSDDKYGISSGGDITISNEAKVIANGGDAGIYVFNEGDLTISDQAEVTASGGDAGYGIKVFSKGYLTISDQAKVIANSGDDACGIYSEGYLTISDQAEVIANGGYFGIYDRIEGGLTISGKAKVTAIGRQYGIYAYKPLNISSTGDGEASSDGQAINIKPVFGENIGFYKGDETSKVAKWGLLVPDIKISPEGTYTFQPVYKGYPSLEPLTVTVNNNGHKKAVSLQLTQGTDSPFVLDKTTLDDIAGGESTTFTVVPKTGLSAETYTDTIKLTGDEGIDQQLQLSFTVKKPTGTGSSSSGGGSTSTPTYGVNFSKIEHGSVNLLKETVAVGEIVKFTLKADEGYEIDTLAVKDANGNSIALTQNEDGTYSFKMPSSKVNLEVTFKTAVEKPKSTTPPEETKWDNPFTDVSETSWYYEAAKFVNENKLFAGTDATTFSPNAVMTREMLWTVLGRLDGEDLSGKEVFKNARTWAMSKGISDGSNPQGQITREQLVTMLWKYLGEPKAQNSDLSQFSDSDRIADYAKEAMAWAVEKGIISGVGNAKLAPKEGATRAQIAVFFMNYSKLIEK